MATEWFCIRDGKKRGPFSSQQLVAMAKSGQLLPTDLLWKQGMAAGKPAGEVQQLFPGTTKPSVPTPPLPTTSPGNKDAAVPNAPSLKATARTAAQATQLAAERTKLSTVTLPSSYLQLGKHCYTTRTFASDFPAEFSKLDQLAQSLAAQEEDSGAAPHTTFAERAKVLAGKGVDFAKKQKAALDQAIAFKRLGQAAFEKHGDTAGPSEIVAGIRAALDRIAAIDQQLAGCKASLHASGMPKRKLVLGSVAAAALLLVGMVGYGLLSGGGDGERRSQTSESSRRTGAQGPGIPVPEAPDVVAVLADVTNTATHAAQQPGQPRPPQAAKKPSEGADPRPTTAAVTEPPAGARNQPAVTMNQEDAKPSSEVTLGGSTKRPEVEEETPPQKPNKARPSHHVDPEREALLKKLLTNAVKEMESDSADIGAVLRVVLERGVKGSDLDWLAQFPAIESVSLPRGPVALEMALDYVYEVRQLRTLDAGQCVLTLDNLRTLAVKCPDLDALAFSYKCLGSEEAHPFDALVNTLAVFPKLRCLAVTFYNLKDKHLSAESHGIWRKCTSLAFVQISHNGRFRAQPILESIKGHPALQTLRLDHHDARGCNFGCLADCGTLTKLIVADTLVEQDVVTSAMLPQLTQLWLAPETRKADEILMQMKTTRPGLYQGDARQKTVPTWSDSVLPLSKQARRVLYNQSQGLHFQGDEQVVAVDASRSREPSKTVFEAGVQRGTKLAEIVHGQIEVVGEARAHEIYTATAEEHILKAQEDIRLYPHIQEIYEQATGFLEGFNATYKYTRP